jgi:hypothetical protein
MRTKFAMLLLASMLAIGAGSIAGCDNMTDCPGAVAQGTSCTTAGLTCFAGADQCTCTSGLWQCKAPDMAVPDLSSPPHDLPHHE